MSDDGKKSQIYAGRVVPASIRRFARHLDDEVASLAVAVQVRAAVDRQVGIAEDLAQVDLDGRAA